MRRFVFICMLLCMLVGAANAQVTRAWIKRSVVPDSGNNTQVATQTFTSFNTEYIYSLSSVSMLDGRVVFQVIKRRRDGSEVWKRIGQVTTGRKRVFAKDMKLDSEGNVVVLAEIKDRTDYDVMVFRFDDNGTPGPTTLIADKWFDVNFNLHHADERAVGLQVRSTGEALVLASEFGDPAMGTFARVREVATDGVVMWNTVFRSGLVTQYSPAVNIPKAIELDGSGNAVILVETAHRTTANNVTTDHLHSITVARIDPVGTMLNEITFDTTAGQKQLEDVPVAMALDASGNANVVATAIVPAGTFSGINFPFQIETVVQLSQFGVNWSRLSIQTDQFGRPGNFWPVDIHTRADGTVLVAGSEEPFGLPNVAIVRALTAGNVTFYKKGEQGWFNAVTSDANNNTYVTGARQVKTNNGLVQSATTRMFSPTGDAVWQFNQADATDKTGTQGVSLNVNSQLDVYTGLTERRLEGTTLYNEASLFRLLQDPKVTSITVSPSAVIGGASFKITVQLDKNALSGGYKVNLTADHSSVNIPADLIVPAGRDDATFTLTTNAVGSQRTVTLRALPGGASATIIVKTGWITTLTLSTNTILGGTSLTGNVTLNTAAPAGGARVQLSTTSSNIILPESGILTIPAGSTSGSFPIGTRAVGTSAEGFVAITYNSTARQLLKIEPPQVVSFTAPASIQGGGYADATLVLSGKAPTGGLQVPVVSDSEAIGGLTVIVPQGADRATFRLTAATVAMDTIVGLTAKTSTASVKSSVTVLAPTLKSVKIDPSTITGGTSTYITVQLTSIAPAGGIVVNLSSDSSFATVPATATVLAGKDRARVAIKSTPVTSQQNATITVTYKAVAKSATLTIVPGT